MRPLARARLAAFLAWRGWKHPQLAAACHCSAPMVSHVLLGRKRPGLDIAHAIERVTAEPKDDGTKWDGGAIRTEEWLTEPAEEPAADPTTPEAA